MCGRAAQFFTWHELNRVMALATPPEEFEPRYNLAPLQSAIVLRSVGSAGQAGVGVSRLVWGLVPSWADGPAIAGSLINARAETIAQKPAFRAAYRARRCVVPISGFFEWARAGVVGLFGQTEKSRAKGRPCFMTSADGLPLLLAGLWESWTGPDGALLETFTIITTTPNELVAGLHDRMPVILDPADARRWLEPGSEGGLDDLLRPIASSCLRLRPVSTRVNNVRVDDAGCVAPIEA